MNAVTMHALRNCVIITGRVPPSIVISHALAFIVQHIFANEGRRHIYIYSMIDEHIINKSTLEHRNQSNINEMLYVPFGVQGSCDAKHTLHIILETHILIIIINISKLIAPPVNICVCVCVKPLWLLSEFMNCASHIIVVVVVIRIIIRQRKKHISIN